MGGPLSLRGEQGARLALWVVLILAWLVAVWQMRQGLTTVPEAEIGGSPLVATRRTVVAAALFSGLELAVVLALLWPRWPVLYATRLAGAALAVVTWSIMITPSAASPLDRVHQRWLAAMAAALVTALLGLLLYRLARWARRGRGAADSAAAP